jgi:Fic family protein
MPFDPSRPYNSLPALPPKAEVESRSVLKACIAARAALASLKTAGALIPNQTVLINSIPLLEAQASSEIENIVTTADRMFEFADVKSEQADPATKEALRYRTALRQGFDRLTKRPVATAMAVDICRTITGVDLDVRKTPGTKLVNSKTGAVIYTPPEGEDVLRKMLANWENWIHDAEDIDPLIRMAVMHYQFEAIHPFIDGNGRTGRVLNLLFLVEQGLLDIPILYLSRYINQHRQDYYRLLLAVTAEGGWEDWLGFMIEAVRETSEWTSQRIEAIRKLADETADQIRQKAPKIYSRELADLIFVQPYCRVANVVEANIAKRQTAAVYLEQLTGLGLLEKRKAGRENLYLNPAFLRLLTQP